MSYSDYDRYVYTSDPEGFFIGENNGTEDDGEQWLHADLSNPLTEQTSLYARAYRITITGAIRSRRLLSILKETTVASLRSIKEWKTTTVIAWVRMNIGTIHAGYGGHSAGICIKANINPANGAIGGYFFGLGATSQVTGSAADGIGLSIGDTFGGNRVSYPNLSTVSGDTWVQLKLEVIPTDLGGGVDRDVINAYENTGTELAPIWTLRQTHTVLDTDPQWTDWNDPDQSNVGYYVEDSETNNNGGGSQSRVWISSFEAHVTVTP